MNTLPANPSSAVRFMLNDQLQRVETLAPTTSLLIYLREHLGLVGTKEGCAEGDCGACTVVVGERRGDDLQLRSVNACIQFLPNLDGKLVYTIEYLKQADGRLHPVQQALVNCHASQCGFCTPGFAMSLWAFYETKQRALIEPKNAAPAPVKRQEICDALSGNLCRCTGYKPIVAAGVQMFDLPKVSHNVPAALAHLKTLERSQSLVYEHSDPASRFIAPQTLDELLQARRRYPTSTLLAGATDVGLWVNKLFKPLGTIISLQNVAGLATMTVSDDGISLGAMVSLTDAYRALAVSYPEVVELWQRFASVPIRNAGTLVGNLANGSPIGDSAPWLIAVGSRVTLANADGERTLLLEDLYLDYMQQARAADEVIISVWVPKPTPAQLFRTWKVCKRFDSDISAVCAAFCIQIEQDIIQTAKVAFGGMAATSKRARQCEAALIGQPWTEATAKAAMQILTQDYQPLSDMRASASYRMQVAQNLLYRFYLETRPQNPSARWQTRAFTQLEVRS